MKKNFLKDEIVSSNDLKSIELWQELNCDAGRERLHQNNLILAGLFFFFFFYVITYVYFSDGVSVLFYTRYLL